MADVPVGVVIVAGGAGRRFGGEGPPKQFRQLAGRPVLAWSIDAFRTQPAVGEIVVVVPRAFAIEPPEWLQREGVRCVAGGDQRSDSVRAGLAVLNPETELVLVHDGARPLVDSALIGRVVEAMQSGSVAVVPAIAVTDTVKEVQDGRVVRTLPRSRLHRVQTPQGFRASILRDLHDRAHAAGFTPTDDAALFERYGLPVDIVQGNQMNLKVTEETDLVVAEALAQRLLAGS